MLFWLCQYRLFMTYTQDSRVHHFLCGKTQSVPLGWLSQTENENKMSWVYFFTIYAHASMCLYLLNNGIRYYYSASSLIQTPLFIVDLGSVQINEFVQKSDIVKKFSFKNRFLP